MLDQLPIEFKTDRLKKEFHDPRLYTVLRVQAVVVAWLIFLYTGKTARITCVYRTDKEQDWVCHIKGGEKYKSVHQVWRGLDIGASGIDKKVCLTIVRIVRLIFPYSGAAGKFSILYHDVGLGVHFHLQAGADEPNYKPSISI